MSSYAASRVYILLDPNSVTDRPPSGGIDKIYYPQSTLTIPGRNFNNVGLRSLVLDNEYYNLVDDSPYGLKNNTITLNGVDYDITPANYDATTLLTYIIDLFNTTGTGTYAGSFNSETNRFTITCDNNFTLVFGPNSPYIELGFILGATYGPSTSITSVVPMNLSGPPNLLIYIPEIQTASLISYNGSPFHFMYPLTGSYPSLSQGSWLNLGKTDCGLVGMNQLYGLTVQLYFTRGGKIWPYIANSSTMYQMLLEFS